MRVIFPSTPRYATKARRAVLTYLTSVGVSDADLADIEQAVGEAIANAVEHGFRERSYFEIRAVVEDGNLRIEVEDDGPGFDPQDLKSPQALRGFGITMMRMLVGRVTFLKRGRLVRLEKRLSEQKKTPNDVRSL